MGTLEDFLSQYDNGNLAFDTVNYRKGAKITEHFGISEGFVMDDGVMDWGYVRLHTGVDRGAGSTVNNIKNVIFAPFNFEKSKFEDFHGQQYGTIINLFNMEFGFIFRIAHMFPTDIMVMQNLLDEKAISRNTIFGPAGTYGASTAIHTHTEVVSVSDHSAVLEDLLHKKFGEEVDKEYDKEFIVQFYRTQEKFASASEKDITTDWAKQKKTRGASFINKFFYRYVDANGNKKTRYSTELLWNGL